MIDTSLIDQLTTIKSKITELTAEKEKLEAEIILASSKDLENTKYKTVTYASEQGNKVTATIAETLKLTYPTLLKKIFGAAYSDAVKEETKYTLTTSAKRMLTKVWTGSYIKQSLNDAIAQLPVDDITLKKLAKKLKGINFETDKKNLINIGNLSEQEANEYAYLISEAAAWQSYSTLLELNGITSDSDIAEITKLIDTAMIVDESTKISVE